MLEAEIIEDPTVSEIRYSRTNCIQNVQDNEIPKDKYFLCYIMFFLLGMLHFLPSTFLATANNFWLYKFRNTSDPTESPEGRTKLQSYFASSQIIVNTIPAICLGYWNVLFGHRFKIVPRIAISLILIALLFYFLTSFIKVNTDNYQVAFFALTLTCSGLITGATAINILTSNLLYPRFPHRYMKICLIGEGVSSILVDLLNIVSVTIFDNLSDATLMYFISGSVIITVTLILFIAISRTEFFKYCLGTMPERTTRKKTSRSKMKAATKKIWESIFIFFVFGLRTASTHTSVTSLVTSEVDKSSAWSSKYFTPVVTFLLSDIWILLGRAISSYLPWNIPERMLCVLAVMSSLLLVPGIWLCNAYPRYHLPVLFGHDWQYALILGMLTFSNGYLINSAMINIPKKTSKEESEVAFNVFSLFMGIAQAVVSPVGLFVIHIL